MTDTEKQTLLIPVVFPDPDRDPLTDSHLEGLAGFHIVLLGYWEIPGGTTPELAREKHETAAKAVLYEMAAKFSRAGASTEIQLHFGPGGSERETMQNRIANTVDPDGVLIAEQISSLSNILVPLRDTRNLDSIVDFVSEFDHEAIFALELYHAEIDDSKITQATEMLETVKNTLLERGFTDADIEITVERTDDPGSAIASKADGHNILVMGETEQYDSDARFFGPIYDSITERTETPVVIVRG